MGGPNTRPTNPRWRTAAILKKTLNRHISATVWSILMKFNTMMQIFPLQGTDRWNFQFFKNQDGGGSHLEKSQKIAISQQWIDRSSRNFTRLCKMGLLTVQTVEKFEFPKYKMADGRHYKKPLNRHISATVWPILMIFGTETQIGPLQGTDR